MRMETSAFHAFPLMDTYVDSIYYIQSRIRCREDTRGQGPDSKEFSVLLG